MATVLLVDDNGSVLLTLAIALRRHGHAVTIAGDGELALDKLRTHSFDALVSDVRMPGLTGPDLATAAHKLYPDMRIVLTSAYPSVDTTADIVAFLRKPIDIEQLHKLLIADNNGDGAALVGDRRVTESRRLGHQTERRHRPRLPLVSMLPAPV